jgi:hypothetical protein
MARIPFLGQWIVLAGLPLYGCLFVPLRVSVGPTVDTQGEFGFIASVSAGVGLGGATTSGFGVAASVGGGVSGSSHTPVLVGRAEIFGQGNVAGIAALRGALILGGRQYFAAQQSGAVLDIGGSLGPLFCLRRCWVARSGLDALNSLQIEYVATDPGRAVFGLPLTFEIDL